MPRHDIDREASDVDRTDPQRAVASLQGIAAAWLLVLALGVVAILPSALSVAEHSAIRTARAASLELSALAQRVPRVLTHRPSLSRGSGTGTAFAAAASRLDPGAL